ncbi:MAG: hypothetical protein KDD51_00535 [Bdellovibrionales bacterium]|nr:hypothetical protein [Bdellovibrionales bacterium]
MRRFGCGWIRQNIPALVSAVALMLVLVGCAKRPSKTERVVPPAPERFSLRAGALRPPEKGVYQGAFPDLPKGDLQNIASNVRAMERLTGKNLTWVQFENDWAESTEFPWQAVDEILKMGRIPYIRILPRSRTDQNLGADPVYTMENFLKGYFDDVLRQWAALAKTVDQPIIIEFAPEVNGNWYPWNGQWNGGAETAQYGDPQLADGPERFRDVYRRVIDIFKTARADKVTWVFHVDSQPQPKEEWNQMAHYYPGDEYIDWIGVSVFGAQVPGDYWNSFTAVLDNTYNELVSISPLKPVAIVEFATIEHPSDVMGKARWIQEALFSLQAGWYPHVRAISYWHERSWTGDPAQNLRVDSSLNALDAYRNGIQNDFFIGDAFFMKQEQTGEAGAPSP